MNKARVTSRVLFILLSALSFYSITMLGSSTASAHPGGLNAQGCHNNRKTGDYHCHRSSAPPAYRFAPATTFNRSTGGTELPVIKMSRTGICHAPGTTYYAKTVNFTSYPSLSDCLAAGGRLPRR